MIKGGRPSSDGAFSISRSFEARKRASKTGVFENKNGGVPGEILAELRNARRARCTGAPPVDEP